MITREQQIQLDIDRIDDQTTAVGKLKKQIKLTRVLYGTAALIIFAVAVGLRVYPLIPLLVVLGFAYGVRQAALGKAITTALNGKSPLDLANKRRELHQLLAAEQAATIRNWSPNNHH